MKKSATSRGREAIQSPLLWWQAPAGTVGRQVIAAARGLQLVEACHASHRERRWMEMPALG